MALAVWTLPLILVGVWVALGRNGFESYRVYDSAGRHWQGRTPLYDATLDGFQYLPQAALIFSAFARLGSVLGGIVWRVVSWALLAQALFRACRLCWPSRWPAAFLVATVIALGPSLSSLVTGQANLITAALMLQATVAMAQRRWWRATGWMMLGLAIKPLMIVLILLAAVLRPRLAPRLALCILLLLALPFAFAPSGYVIAQSRTWLTKLAISSQPDRYFEDLRGLVFKLGWSMPHPLLRVARGVAALATTMLVVLVRRRHREPSASLYVFACAAVYLMLFNPRTQPNSYVIAVLVVALAAARAALAGDAYGAAGLAVVSVCWCGMNPHTVLWLRPLVCIAVAALLVREIVRAQGPACADGAIEAEPRR